MSRAALTSTLPRDPNGSNLQVLIGNGTRVNLTAGSSTSRATLPAGAAGKIILVRCTDYVWMNFGDNTVNATATSASALVPPGEGVVAVPATATNCAVLRTGAADAAVQLETVDGE